MSIVTIDSNSVRIESEQPRSPNELVRLAVVRVREGTLPEEAPGRVWGGVAGLDKCTLCHEEISEGQLRVSVTEQPHGPYGAIQLHPTCFQAWYSASHVKPAQ